MLFHQWSIGAAFAAAIALFAVPAAAGMDQIRSDAGDGLFEDEVACLAMNIYWEGRSEPATGQQAIAHVTLNRVADRGFPDTICAVVTQGGEARRHRCQFSWWCDGRSDRPRERQAWDAALYYARMVMNGHYPDPTGGALYFHKDGISPRWSKVMEWTGRIGAHHYYR